MAYFFDSSLTRPTMAVISAIGGAKRIKGPTRAPRGEPQPNPGKPIACHRNRTHGASETQKLILPAFMVSSIIHRESRYPVCSLRFLGLVNKPYRRAPLVLRTDIAERVGPCHGLRFLFAFGDGPADCIGFM